MFILFVLHHFSIILCFHMWKRTDIMKPLQIYVWFCWYISGKDIFILSSVVLGSSCSFGILKVHANSHLCLTLIHALHATHTALLVLTGTLWPTWKSPREAQVIARATCNSVFRDNAHSHRTLALSGAVDMQAGPGEREHMGSWDRRDTHKKTAPSCGSCNHWCNGAMQSHAQDMGMR